VSPRDRIVVRQVIDELANALQTAAWRRSFVERRRRASMMPSIWTPGGRKARRLAGHSASLAVSENLAENHASNRLKVEQSGALRTGQRTG
jgi:hypothetical protein